MEKLWMIEIPFKSKDHTINNVGCLRYNDDKVSSCITPEQSGYYLNNKLHKIIGYTVSGLKKYIIIGQK
jgi:hypothetical protein